MAKKKTCLTTEEQDEAGRAMVRAALEAFGEFPGNTDDEDQNEMARRVVRALAAAGNAEAAELRKLKGTSFYLTTDPCDAVATAFWIWQGQGDFDVDVDEVAPASVIGNRLLGFAQGLAAARAMTEALDLMEDGDAYAFASRGVESLLPNIPNEELTDSQD